MDAGEGFDATGITVAGLLVASAISTLIDGSGSFRWATLIVLLVGGWIPAVERPLPEPMFALVFAGIGAYAGAWSARLRR